MPLMLAVTPPGTRIASGSRPATRTAAAARPITRCRWSLAGRGARSYAILLGTSDGGFTPPPPSRTGPTPPAARALWEGHREPDARCGWGWRRPAPAGAAGGGGGGGGDAARPPHPLRRPRLRVAPPRRCGGAGGRGPAGGGRRPAAGGAARGRGEERRGGGAPPGGGGCDGAARAAPRGAGRAGGAGEHDVVVQPHAAVLLDDQHRRRLHAAGVAAGRLPGVERRHQAQREMARSSSRTRRPCRDDRLAGEDVALRGAELPALVPGPVVASGPVNAA